jgi:hypothetical protein
MVPRGMAADSDDSGQQRLRRFLQRLTDLDDVDRAIAVDVERQVRAVPG